MKIRQAKFEDAETLSQIAFAAKSYWNYPENWLKIWKDALTITPEFIEKNEVYLAESDGKVLGFYALIVENDKVQLEHLWISPENIGGGIGKILMADAIEKAKSFGATSMEIESDPNAEGFIKNKAR
ncbi:MAG: GNAT family N-acetyltransferase [Pyrinomonadaceae bacterium]|nr:GNAT family N-acetyltransferase [Pyrinomonadaceae bacterium]